VFNVFVWPRPFSSRVGEVHDTPMRPLGFVPILGLGTIDQVVPFHDSICIRKNVLLKYSPYNGEGEIFVTDPLDT